MKILLKIWQKAFIFLHLNLNSLNALQFFQNLVLNLGNNSIIVNVHRLIIFLGIIQFVQLLLACVIVSY